jgi:hypothetical protein
MNGGFMKDIKITLDLDKDTANRLLNEAFDIITEIKEILKDEDMDDQEALQNIDYVLRKVK